MDSTCIICYNNQLFVTIAQNSKLEYIETEMSYRRMHNAIKERSK